MVIGCNQRLLGDPQQRRVLREGHPEVQSVRDDRRGHLPHEEGVATDQSSRHVAEMNRRDELPRAIAEIAPPRARAAASAPAPADGTPGATARCFAPSAHAAPSSYPRGAHAREQPSPPPPPRARPGAPYAVATRARLIARRSAAPKRAEIRRRSRGVRRRARTAGRTCRIRKAWSCRRANGACHIGECSRERVVVGDPVLDPHAPNAAALRDVPNRFESSFESMHVQDAPRA